MPKRGDAYWNWAGVVAVILLGQGAHWLFWRGSFDRMMVALEPLQPLFNIFIVAAIIGPMVGALLAGWLKAPDDPS